MSRTPILLVCLLLLAGCAAPKAPQVHGSGKVHPDTPAPADAVPASRLLADIKVAPSLSMSGYSRDRFTHWTDADGNGCDTRDDVLAAESQLTPAPSCERIESGNWYSPYDDVTVTASTDMDVDHLVALAEAWRSGAANWNDAGRERYANDLDYPISLLAVTAATNRSKGDQDPAAWMPPNASYDCVYLAHWVAVKWRWNLTMDPAEHAAVKRGMDRCSAKSLLVADPGASMKLKTTGVGSVTGPAVKVDPPAAKPNPATPAPQVSAPRTCAEAQAAGLGPFRRGVDAEYESYRDGDGDGVVCE